MLLTPFNKVLPVEIFESTWVQLKTKI